jgi:hypothetical protein
LIEDKEWDGKLQKWIAAVDTLEAGETTEAKEASSDHNADERELESLGYYTIDADCDSLLEDKTKQSEKSVAVPQLTYRNS